MISSTWQRHLESKRVQAFDLGVEHREALVERLIGGDERRVRPFLKEIVDEVIEEVQGARLVEEVLPLDVYAQTEMVNGRVVVSINSRIAEIDGVKDPAGVAHVAKWHESVHIETDIRAGDESQSAQHPLPGIDAEIPRLIVCRRIGPHDGPIAEREFIAENAGLAAAIARADLIRSPAFVDFRLMAQRGGVLGGSGWQLLYRTAEDIGVNITALRRYLTFRGICYVPEGSRTLIANPQFSGKLTWH